MKRFLFFVLLLILAIFVFSSPRADSQATQPQPKINLKLLYAGTPGSPREADFRIFLLSHFTQVETTNVATLKPDAMAKFDVLLIDAQPKEGDGASALDVPSLTLPDTYTRPTLTIGVMGGLFTSRARLKTGYL